MRFHGGLMYARVASNSIDNFDFPTHTVNNNYQSAFSGFGVRGGMGLQYNITSAFNLHGNIAGGLLAGSTKSSYSEASTQVDKSSVLDTHSLGVVAPEIDAKAGLQYQYDLANGHLLLDAGWLWATYINTLEDNAEDSFGIQGLFFGAHWVGNIA